MEENVQSHPAFYNSKYFIRTTNILSVLPKPGARLRLIFGLRIIIIALKLLLAERADKIRRVAAAFGIHLILRG